METIQYPNVTAKPRTAAAAGPASLSLSKASHRGMQMMARTTAYSMEKRKAAKATSEGDRTVAPPAAGAVSQASMKL